MNNSAEASLSLEYSDAETASHILGSISPDNLQSPEGIVIEAWIDGNTLKINIQCMKGVGSLVATLDDMISCVQAAERAISQMD